jgi:uncharacterized membrane protein
MTWRNAVTETLQTSPYERAMARALRAPWAVPVAMALIALAARLYGLDGKPLWYDEVITQKRAALPVAEMLEDSFLNKHYPLYFLLTKPFAVPQIWGAGLRLPAALFGAVGVLMAARIGFALGGLWAALATGTLMALSPMEVQYGQEARPYSLMSAAILTSLWGLVRLLGAGTAEPRRVAGSPWMGWVAYTAGMAVALNALGGAAACFAAINLLVAALALMGKLPKDWSMRGWLLANLVVIVLWLPGLSALVAANASAATRGLTWIPPLTLELAHDVLSAVYLLQVSDMMTFERLAAPVPILGFAVLALAGAGGVRLARTPVGLLLIGLALFMPVTLALISLLAMPVFVPRYMLWSTGPYFILAGVGLATLAAVPRAVAGAALGLAAAMSLAPYYAAETKPRWDLAAAHIAQRAGLGDAMIVSSGLGRVMLDAYMVRHGDLPLAILEEQSREEIAQAIRSGASVWVVHGRAGQGRDISRAEFVANWPELPPPRRITRLGGHITISQHKRPHRRG